VHREPKPQPQRRSHEHDGQRRSRDYDHHANAHVENGHGHRHSNGHGHGKRKISTLTGHLVAAVGEFVGTFMFLYFAFAGQIMLVTQAGEVSRANGLASSQQNIFTALLYGLSLLVNAWAFYRISGGLFNPAVSVIVAFSVAEHKTDYVLGHVWHGHRRLSASYPRALPFPCPTLGRHVRWRSGSGHVPG
jgi:aquaporin related protein